MAFLVRMFGRANMHVTCSVTCVQRSFAGAMLRRISRFEFASAALLCAWLLVTPTMKTAHYVNPKKSHATADREPMIYDGLCVFF